MWKPTIQGIFEYGIQNIGLPDLCYLSSNERLAGKHM